VHLRTAAQTDFLTLNQRVPGSSPGAPTKLFKNLAVSLTVKIAAVFTTVSFSVISRKMSAQNL
jgi:hypothetical protein